MIITQYMRNMNNPNNVQQRNNQDNRLQKAQVNAHRTNHVHQNMTKIFD